jgi:hypothetical protein
MVFNQCSVGRGVFMSFWRWIEATGLEGMASCDAPQAEPTTPH